MGDFPDQRITQVLENGEPAVFELEEEVNFSEELKNTLYEDSYPSINQEETLAVAGSGATTGYAAAGFPGPETVLKGVEAYSQLPQEWQALAAPGAIVAGFLTYQAGKGTLKYIFQ